MSVEERKKVRAEGGLEKMELDSHYESILAMLASGVTEVIFYPIYQSCFRSAKTHC